MIDANDRMEDIRKTDVIDVPDPVVLVPGKRYRFRGKIYRAEVCEQNLTCIQCAAYGDLCGVIDCDQNNVVLIEEN